MERLSWVTWTALLVVLLALIVPNNVVADYIVQGPYSYAEAHAICEEDASAFLAEFPNEPNVTCQTTYNSSTVGYVQCVYGTVDQWACGTTWGFPLPSVDTPKNCGSCGAGAGAGTGPTGITAGSTADNGSNPITTGLGLKVQSEQDIPTTRYGLLGFTRFYSSINTAGWPAC